MLHLGMTAVLADGAVRTHDAVDGTTMENGVFAQAVPTARAAPGEPAMIATSPYEATSP